MMAGMGATIMGRNMFGPIRDEWRDSDWKGWWGDDPPAAGDQAISIAGGASCARQAIAAGLVDEIDLQVNPVILGSGERLFDGFEPGDPTLELVRVLEAPGVAHLRYRVTSLGGKQLRHHVVE
jgi:dihydrofolate reductase